MGTNWTNKAPSFSKVITHEKRWRSCQCQWSITLLEVLLPLKDLDKWKKRNTSSIFPPIHKGKNVHYTVEPRFNEVLRNWPNAFTKRRFRYIEVLFHTFYYNWGRLFIRDFKHRQRQQQRKRRQQCRERDWEDKAVRSHRHRKLWAVNKQRENGKFYTSCEKSFFFHLRFFFRRRPGITISSRRLACVAGAGYFFKGRAREHAKRKAPPLLFSPRASSRFLPSP